MIIEIELKMVLYRLSWCEWATTRDRPYYGTARLPRLIHNREMSFENVLEMVRHRLRWGAWDDRKGQPYYIRMGMGCKLYF